jgi:hypothetical protein
MARRMSEERALIRDFRTDYHGFRSAYQEEHSLGKVDAGLSVRVFSRYNLPFPLPIPHPPSMMIILRNYRLKRERRDIVSG